MYVPFVCSLKRLGLSCLSTAALVSLVFCSMSSSATAQKAEKALTGGRPVSPSISYVETPLTFEENRGQDQASALYEAKGHGYSVALTSKGAVVSVPGTTEGKSAQHSIGLSLIGSNPQMQVLPEMRRSGVSNYIPSSDQSTWRMGVPGYGRVNYHQVYPGIDLSFYGQKQMLEYDFRLQPNADPSRIRLALEGAESASIDAEGNLDLKVTGSHIRFLKPVSYQTSATGERIPVTSEYALTAANGPGTAPQVSFVVGPHDASRELVIDPVLSYGLQLAYADYTTSGLTVDGAGNTYVVGQNQSKGFYVSKYSSTGTLIFNTVVGSGTVTCYPTGIAIDSTGKMYVVGEAPPGLPTTSNAYLTTSPSAKTYYSVPFIAVIPASGAAPTYLSYFGGTNNTDYTTGIALDSSNDVYITGYEESTNFPTTTGAYLTAYPGANYSAFVAKFDPTKSGAASLIYSTFLGASTITSVGSALAVDASGNAYVAVQSYQGYPVTTGAFSYSGGYSDSYTTGSYVTKLNPTGSALVYSAYIGPGLITGIAIDTSLDAYITGTVAAEDFPTTAGAYQTTYPGGFVAELNPSASALTYSTFLSGPSGAYSPNNNTVFPQSIAIAPGCASACAAYVSGYTQALDYPAINPIQSTPLPTSYSPYAFITEIAGNGASSPFSTYLGGITANVTAPFGTPLFPTPSVDVDSSGNIYFAANVTATDVPVTLPAGTQIPYSYVARINAAAGALVIPYPATVNFDNYDYSGEAIGISSTLSGIPVPLLLRNLGSAPVTISSLSFSPATEFSETDSCGMSIPAGGTCTLNLAFTPTASGKRTATLSITSNGSASPLAIPLSGTGQAEGYLQVSTAQLTFPDLALGSTSASQTITLTNIGKSLVNLQPFALSPVRQNWGNGSDFQLLSTCPAQLAAAASCSIGVTFTPIATGPRAASVSVTGDGFGNLSVYLYGAGINGTSQGTVSLSATILNFNSQLINTASPRQTVVLTNTSTTPISVYGVSIQTSGQASGSDFSIYNGSCINTTTQIEIYPQGTCAINIAYTPTVAAAETGTLTITDSATGSPRTVSLTGTGVAATQTLEVTPGNYVFPDQPVGLPSAASYFYVYNTGTAPITVSRVLVTGDFSLYSTNCAGAILKPNPAVGYEPSPNCSVRVNFNPTATGARTGTLTLLDSAGTSQQVFTLTGNGITATGAAFLEPSALVFPVQAVGTTSPTQHLVIANPGNSTLNITNITTTGDYAIVDSCANGTFPVTITAGRNCAVDISFTPTTATNPDKGSVVVSSSAGTATLPITGSSQAASIALGVTPTAISFGSIQTTIQSYTYYAYVRNTGTSPINLASATITGTNATDYSFYGGNCGFSASTLAPGTSCYIQVYFTPSAAGTRTATLSLVDDAGTQTIPLSGVGVTALTGAQALPAGIAFDNVPIGHSATSNIYVTLYNYSTTAALSITTAKITAGGSAFMIPAGLDNCSGKSVAASSTCYVQVGFSPTATGYATGTLTFTDSTNKTYTTAIAGYSTPVATSSYLDPSSLSFPGQVLTTISNSQSVTLYNTSNVSMTVGTLTATNTMIGSTTTGAFSAGGAPGGNDGCSGVVIAARGRCQVSVVFAPTATGAATGSIVFPATYAGGGTVQYTATLSGTGIAVKDAASLSPASITFQDQAVGAQPNSGADASQYFTLYNIGNLPYTVGTLTGTDVVIGATTTGDFTTASSFGGYDGCTGQTVSPGSNCQVSVGFNPSSAAAKAGSIKFPVTYADKTTTTLTGSLAGKGIGASSKVIVSPSSGQFDVQVIGTTSDNSETLTFTLSNTGNLPVKIATSTVTSNFSFVSDYCSGSTVAINSNCQIVLAFSPTKTGSISGTLSIPDNAAGSPHKVALVGTGIAANQQIVLSQTAVAFGNQVVSTRSAQVYVLVSNQSGATVPVNSVVLGGANPSDFILSDSCSGSSIYGHSYCQLGVIFAPAAASTGARSATITETDTATGSPRVVTLTGTGITAAPSVAIYPASLNFGSQGLGTKSAPQTFSVTNTGAASLTISKVASSNATEFPLVTNGCSAKTLASGANCLVTMTFNPNAGSTQTTTISVTDNATGSPQTITATGLSTGIPQAKLTPASLTFASQGVGIASAAQTITLANAGTDTLQISALTITGTNATDFKQTNTCGTSIVAGANCTISVTFNPTAVGSRTATVSVTDNAGNTAGTVQTATLTGTGTGVQKIAFSPTSLTFASTNVGASSAAKVITVSNPGTATLTLNSIGITPTGDYTQTNTCGTSLAVGSTCTISVVFSPATAGTRTASVSVVDGATGSPHTVALTGTAVGVPTAALSATSVAFGNQAIGVASAAQTVTLTNSGTGSLVVASLALGGTNASSFTATSSTCPGTLAAGTACTISFTFKPASAGAKSATLTITDNSGNVSGTKQTVALTGTGAGTPQAALSASTMTFASDPVGTAEGPQSLTLSNSGTGALQVSSIVVSGTNASDFLEFDTCTPSVAAAGNCEIALYFVPTAVGTRTATVTITDNANNVVGATQKFTVTGTATGTPQATLSLTSMSFGTVKVGSQSAGQSVTLTNSGNAPLTVSSVTLTGTDPGDYNLFSSCSTVSDGSSCVVVVFFKPTAAGSRPATLKFTDNANGAAGATQTVTLTGTGN